MLPFAKFNNGYKYILMIISKYGFAIPLKTKTGIAVADALKNLFKKHLSPAMLWTNKGK